MEERTRREPEPLADCADPERRATPRHPCRRRPLVRALLRPTLRLLRVEAMDVSTRGVGLLLAEPVEVGTELAVFPPSPELGKSCVLTARVVHVEARPGDHWYVGCTLLRPLRAAVLRDFLG